MHKKKHGYYGGFAVRTTLDLPEELVNKAKRLSGARTKTMAVCLALQEYVRKKNMERILEYRGKIDLDLTVEKVRGERDKG